ncbi:MAG TPA: hypothetical protein DCQ52_00975, partial [Acidimicrobiaceae bacterium]|nr:hypothetical protein [Acidimicrobiaceae bacterium]
CESTSTGVAGRCVRSSTAARNPSSVCVFGTFVLGDLRAIKLIGLGLAVAVLLDATVVRMVLVPATMELLGDRNWWLPRRLGRMLPHVHVSDPPMPVAPVRALVEVR